jgi:hypothetical protein
MGRHLGTKYKKVLGEFSNNSNRLIVRGLLLHLIPSVIDSSRKHGMVEKCNRDEFRRRRTK